MLVEDVPVDFKHVEAKQWFGMTGRQFLCALPAGVLAACAIGLNVWANFTGNQIGLQAEQVVNNLLPVFIVPLILYGWWRPAGLLPEQWLRAWKRQKQVLDKGPITRVGPVSYKRGARPLPASVMFEDDPETPIDYQVRPESVRHARHK